MRIARFTLGDDPVYGVVSPEHPDTIFPLVGDPLYTEIRPTGKHHLIEDVRLLAPVIPRSKIVCVGKNYAAHASEMGGEVPSRPLLFIKPNTAVIGPGDPIVLPDYTHEASLEAELAVVIKRIAKNVPAESALDYVLGYTVANDVTARDTQRDEDQWFRAKAFDTSCPLGPVIDTELDPASARVTSSVDGEPKQDGTTADMVRSVPELIAEITRATTLLPGDVILTGTPAGVATIAEGQSVTVAISGIGELTNPVVRR